MIKYLPYFAQYYKNFECIQYSLMTQNSCLNEHESNTLSFSWNTTTITLKTYKFVSLYNNSSKILVY